MAVPDEQIVPKTLETINDEGPSFFWGARTSNVRENEAYHPRRRRVISHGYCSNDDTYWKPHFAAMEPQYTENGPDWHSLLRYIPSPKNEEQKDEELWPEKSSHLRTYLETHERSAYEWTYYSNGYNTGKKCYFDELHLRSLYGANEVTDASKMGSRRKGPLIDNRNGLPIASFGDKHYQVPEYSPEFHKKGSTLPLACFGHAFVKKNETIIPLFSLPETPVEPYTIKDKRRQKTSEINEVVTLDNWKPATPLRDTIVADTTQQTTKIK